jgi:SAM-dependent methyltransferase
MPPPGVPDSSRYAASVAAEKQVYRDCLEVHDLPPIFHYWSNRYVRPKLEACGFSSPEQLFQRYVDKQFANGRKERRIVSIGAGNCDLEVELAAHLVQQGYTDFTLDCLDLNSDMLERGRAHAATAAVSARMNFVALDINAWTATAEYDCVLANQSLHHIVNLENLFSEIKRSLKPGGTFIVSDMIGRNGHQRWPEALELVREFWRKLAPTYRFNRSLRRYEEIYEDWDCSQESFEGVRAQDILALLVESFSFELFIPFANIIEPFVDRSFGGNFDPDKAWDRNFIDSVQERDEREIAAGVLKPTHMLAVLGTDPLRSMQFTEPLSPRSCIRDTSRVETYSPGVETAAAAAYEWNAMPLCEPKELEFLHGKWRVSRDLAESLAALVEERTQWAQRLDEDLGRAAGKIDSLHSELQERTTWALRLNEEIAEARRKLADLHRELAERTAWVERLQQEREELVLQIEERTIWAQRLDNDGEELNACLDRLQRESQEAAVAHRDELESLAWARPLDRRFHHQLDYVVRKLRGFVQSLRRMV